jgi:cysteine synthase B
LFVLATRKTVRERLNARLQPENHPLLRTIGKTPLVELRRIPRSVRVFAKLESQNPGGSVKDRAARGIVLAAFRSGALPGKRLLDASSGNTGIAYAMLGAALGFRVTICLPGSASSERRRILRAYGAEIVETDPEEGSDGAIVEARKRAAGFPEAYFYADQYANPENPRAHETTTGPELLEQLRHESADAFLCGLGTSGTFVGISRFLKEASPGTVRVAVQPDAPFHGIEGLKHMATAIVPPVFDPSLADLRASISTEEAQEMCLRLAREEGILAGVSAGAALGAALNLASKERWKTVVVIFPDGGERYLSERFWGA